MLDPNPISPAAATTDSRPESVSPESLAILDELRRCKYDFAAWCRDPNITTEKQVVAASNPEVHLALQALERLQSLMDPLAFRLRAREAINDLSEGFNSETPSIRLRAAQSILRHTAAANAATARQEIAKLKSESNERIAAQRAQNSPRRTPPAAITTNPPEAAAAACHRPAVPPTVGAPTSPHSSDTSKTADAPSSPPAANATNPPEAAAAAFHRPAVPPTVGASSSSSPPPAVRRPPICRNIADLNAELDARLAIDRAARTTARSERTPAPTTLEAKPNAPASPRPPPTAPASTAPQGAILISP